MNRVVLCGDGDEGVSYRYQRDTKNYDEAAVRFSGREFEIGPGDWLRVDGGTGFLLVLTGAVDAELPHDAGGLTKGVHRIENGRFIRATQGIFVTEAQ